MGVLLSNKLPLGGREGLDIMTSWEWKVRGNRGQKSENKSEETDAEGVGRVRVYDPAHILPFVCHRA